VTSMMEIGTEQTILYITHWQIEDYERAGWTVKPLHRTRGDHVHCFIAIEPVSCGTAPVSRQSPA
jgi:hypothetical protein